LKAFKTLIDNTMKTKLIISVIAFLAITTLANGQNNGTASRQQNVRRQGIAYVDKNNNGICDNYENQGPGAARCRRSGNFNNGAQTQGQGQKGWCRGQQGQGRGRNFVDANKNGICDNNEISPEK
jgi:hypothetical protein